MEDLTHLNKDAFDFPLGGFFKKNSFLKTSILLFLLIIVSLFLFYFFFICAPKEFPQNIVFTVDKGESLRDISLLLQEKNIIKSRVAFESFVIIYGGEKHISPGDYLFEKKLPVFEVARRISIKDRHVAPVKITIPEGFDINQIAEVIAPKLDSFNENKFLLNNKNKEGYLFQDTYFFFVNDNEEVVQKSMTENFDKKIKLILPDLLSSGKSEKEIITMASLVEREAKGDSDRGVISGILWNRIQKNMPLQVDAMPETYKKKGLPEQPICNPGLEAIKAAIYPVNSSYLYYLHDKNGGIHYAKTFLEHKNNKLKYLK